MGFGFFALEPYGSIAGDSLLYYLNIVIKLVYLQTKHLQSIFPRFLIVVLNSKIELLDSTLAGRLFHIRESLK